MDGSKLVDMETRLARVRVALVIGSVAMLVATTALYAWLKMEPFDGRLNCGGLVQYFVQASFDVGRTFSVIIIAICANYIIYSLFILNNGFRGSMYWTFYGAISLFALKGIEKYVLESEIYQSSMQSCGFVGVSFYVVILCAKIIVAYYIFSRFLISKFSGDLEASNHSDGSEG